MFRRLIAVLAVLSLPACDGCEFNAAPTLSTRYSPLHPANDVPVEFQIDARDNDGVQTVQLYVYEYELYVGPTNMQSAQQRAGGTWGLVQEWSYPSTPNVVSEQFTLSSGFPAESFVKFIVRATDALGAAKGQEWNFAAGTWPFGNSSIPLWGNGAPGERIDIAFVADSSDYATGRSMLGDLEGLIFDGYHTNNAVVWGLGMWQFYYSPDRGFISDYDAGTFIMDIPTSVTNSTIIDHAAVIHTSVKRDWASGGNFGTEPQNIGTAVHESAHAAFNLADEYAGGGHFTSSDPYHNNYDSEADCQAYNAQHGWPEEDCEHIEGSWWRPEPATLQCIMLDDQDANMPDFARSCMQRAIWYYLELSLGGTP